MKPRSPGTASLLLVDDRPENLLALEAVLEPLQRPMLRATSGEEALKRLLHDDFAVILLDVQMPGLDGFETAAHIKQRERSRHIPIIFLTAINSERHHVARGYSSGAVDFISKPFDPWILRAKVSAFIDLFEKNLLVERQADLLELRLRERDAAQEQLAAKAAELERSNEDLRRFTAVASHDLSSPLFTARGHLELLLADHGDVLDGDGRDLVERALRSLDTMRSLIDDLLALAAAGSRSTEARDVDVNAVVSDVLEAMAHTVAVASATVVVDDLPQVRASRTELCQVFQNLIGNAIKFARPGVAPSVRITATRHDDAWRFAVCDNGIGIAAGDRGAALQPFERLLPSRYPGTGIGLAICDRIIQRRGGQLSLDEAPSGGTVVSFVMPDHVPGAGA